MTSKSKYIIGGVGIVVVGAVVGVLILSPSNTQENVIDNVSETTEQVVKTNIAQDKIAAENPINLFLENFNDNDYKMNVEGVMKGVSPLYFEKGSIVRLGDPKNEPNEKYIILKNGSIFFVYAGDKQFTEMSDSQGRGKTLVESFRVASPIDQLIKDTGDNTIVWEDAGDGYFISQQFSAPLSLGSAQEDLIEIKILTNQSTHLIDEMWIRFDGTGNWEDAAKMTYMLIDDMDEIKQFPFDFSKREIK